MNRVKVATLVITICALSVLLLIVSANTHQATVFSLDDGQRELDDSNQPAPPFSDNAVSLEYADGKTKILLKDENANEDKVLYSTFLDGVAPDTLQVSPEGRSIVFSEYIDEQRRDTKIVILEIDSGSLLEVKPDPSTGFPTNPIWSPDGTRVAYISYEPESMRTGLWIFNPYDGTKTKIDTDGTFAPVLIFGSTKDLAWSFDSMGLEYFNDRSQKAFRVDFDGHKSEIDLSESELNEVLLAPQGMTQPTYTGMVKPLNIRDYNGTCGNGYSGLYPTYVCPASSATRPHPAVDMSGGPTKIGCGTPLVAACDGVIVSAHKYSFSGINVCGNNIGSPNLGPRNLGWHVVLRCDTPNANLGGVTYGGRIYIVYAHLSSIEPGMAYGKWLDKGTKIASVGSTGYSSGPHLHYQMEKDNQPSHPYYWNTIPGIQAYTWNPMYFIQAHPPVIKNTRAWDFSKGSQGWVANGSMSGPSQEATGLVYGIRGGDPYITGPMTSFSAASYPRLLLQMASQTDSCGQLYFRRQGDAGFAEERHVALPIKADGHSQIIDIDMRQNKHWSGTINQLRLDPACNPDNNRVVRIDKLSFNPPKPPPPPPPARKYFNETTGINGGHTDTTWWFPWMDSTSSRQVVLMVSNAGSATAKVAVTVKGQPIKGSPFSIAAGGASVATHPNLKGGPMKVQSTNGQPIVASQRVHFPSDSAQDIDMSSELPSMNSSLDAQSAANTWWFPWYDASNNRINTILIGNPGTRSARVEIRIAGKLMAGSPHDIPAGAVWTPRFTNVMGGPVVITSLNNQPIFASQRSHWPDKQFSEALGIPNSMLDTVWWAPWYDARTGKDDWILVGNPGPNTAKVEIYLAGKKIGENSVAPGTVWPPLYRDTGGGPVKVVSTNGQKIFVSKRTLWHKVFDETMSMPNKYTDSTWWFPWYDDNGARVAIFVVANAGTKAAQVDLYIGGKKMTGSAVTINPGATWAPRYDTAVGGPVKIVSTNGEPIVASLRVLSNGNTVFNEVIGIPEKLIYPPTGTIKIVKATEPAGGTDFSFTGDLGSFRLDDGGRKTFNDLQAGDYKIREPQPAGWERTGIDCRGGSSSVITDGVKIALKEGQTITCTFSSKEIVNTPKATISISPATQEVSLDGGPFCVDVRVARVNDLGGFEFTLAFPVNLLQATRARIGPMLGSSGRTPIPLDAVIDNRAGTINYGAGSTGSKAGANGGGKIAEVCFRPQKVGDAKLRFTASQLVDTLGKAMPRSQNNGVIQIRANACYWADVDCSGAVDIKDIQAVAGRWGARSGQNDYQAKFDLDNDGDIDILDVQRVASQWNWSRQFAGKLEDIEQAAAPVKFAIDPASLKLAPGETKRIDLVVSDASNLAAYEAILTFNPKRIEVTKLVQTGFLERSGRTKIVLGPDINNELGRVKFGVVTFGSQAGVNGSGVIARVTVKAKSQGSTQVKLENVQAADPEADPLQVTTKNGLVEVAVPSRNKKYSLFLPFVER